MQPPFISIITPCLNRAEFVGEAIESVVQQAYPDLEHIVIDGGSTDGTLEVLKAYPNLRVISEPDRGVYDALNKGLQLAQGEVVGLLNTDDLYAPGILSKVSELFLQNPASLAVLGGACIFSQVDGDSRRMLAEYRPYQQEDFLGQVTWGVPLFNAWYFRRQVFERYGCFDTHYRYAADRDFLIRLALDGMPYTVLDETICLYRHHLGSLTFNDLVNAESGMVLEFREIAQKYLRLNQGSTQWESCFRRWHSLITSHQALLALGSFRAARSLHYAQIGLQLDPRWLLIFGREFAESAARRLFAPRSASAHPKAAV